MNSIDVKELHDIPNIEDYLDWEFQFVMFERGDEICIYNCEIGYKKFIVLDFHCKEQLLELTHKLYDILSFEDLLYLSWGVWDEDNEEILESYCYRPLIPEKEKNYL